MVLTTTLIYLLRGNDVLLAMKKRGFGVGKLNGPGGKAQAGETPEQAAVRECEEETGLKPVDLEHKGIVEFYFVGKSEWDQHCHIFIGKKWEGEAHETEEMRPQWHSRQELPFSKMWDDDHLWLPKVVEHELAVHRKFTFEPATMKVVEHVNMDPA